MKLLETRVRQKIDMMSSRFLFEVDIDMHVKQEIIEGFKQAAASDHYPGSVQLWVRNYPSLMMVLLSEVARENYNTEYRGFWKNFYDVTGITSGNPNLESLIGNVFINSLKANGLETDIPGFKYVGPIMAHAGLPESLYTEYLKWLSILEPGLPLSIFMDISSVDFFQTLKYCRVSPVSMLGKVFDYEEGYLILWSMANLSGECAFYVENDLEIPEKWQGTFKERLFYSVQSFYNGYQTNNKHVNYRYCAPTLYWDTSYQYIAALLPQQRVPNAMKARLVEGFGSNGTVLDSYLGQPLLDEFIGDQLADEDNVHLVVEYVRDDLVLRKRELKYAVKDPVLFYENGLLVEEKQIYSPGRYLILFKSNIDNNSGIAVLENPPKPVGWFDWHAALVDCSQGSSWGRYNFNYGQNEVIWKLGPLPQNSLNFIGNKDVWINIWPKVYVKNLSIEELCRGLLQLDVINHKNNIVYHNILHISVESPGESCVTVSQEQEWVVIDLNSISMLDDYAGEIKLKLVMPYRWKCQNIEFVKLAEAGIDYIMNTNNGAMELTVQGSGFTLSEVNNCSVFKKVNKGYDVWNIIPPNYLREPEVRILLQYPNDSSAIISLKIPVKRGVLIAENITLGSWQQLPLSLSLKDISISHRIRLELDEPFFLKNDEASWRLVYGSSFFAGKAKSANLLEIPLHRLRDVLGSSPYGLLQVYVSGRWVDVVDFGMPVVAPEGDPSKTLCSIKGSFLLVDELVNNQLLFNWDKVQSIIKMLEANNNSDSCSVLGQPGEEELVRLSGAHALLWAGMYERAISLLRPLTDRTDISEVKLFLAIAELRCNFKDSLLINNLHHVVGKWKHSLEKILIMAELSYKTSVGGRRSKGAFEACRRNLSIARNVNGTIAIDYMVMEAVVFYLLNNRVGNPPDLSAFGPCNAVDDVNRLFELLTGLQQYLSGSMVSWKYRPSAEILNSPLVKNICHPLDVTYIRLCMEQSLGNYDISGQILNNNFSDNKAEYYGLDLVKYRQEKVCGDVQKAEIMFQELFDKYTFLIDEY